MLSKLLRHVLYILVHLVVGLLVAIQNVYRKFRAKKCYLSDDKVSKLDIEMILEHVPKMRKTLKHLVLIADTDHHSFSDLARVVIWSLVAGIPYVSFYDVTGQLHKFENKLFLEVERNKSGVPGCVKWCNKPDLNGYTNGIQSNSTYVNIFVYEDGRPKIAQCVQQIVENKLPYRRKSKEFTAQEFDETLSLVYPSIPCPDLVLYTGPLCSTHGLLPWQIRLTEFIQLSLYHTLNINDYLNSLFKFNNCDQRFGK